MSQTIHVLPDHVANQIAAGEVIQRPASVVKELMENAVDAGATHVEVHVIDAGRTSIQVVDNGCGMSVEDARLCFERHATSKLQSADDLFSLATKGFRGEALASIAAIAHVDVTTFCEGSDVGVTVRCHGSEMQGEEPKARAVGTTFHVKNLFWNVPARRNFLKSDAVEMRHIVDEFQRVAFAHPSLSFTLTHQNANLFQLKPGTLRQRIVGILGPKHDERLVPVNEETDVVRIEGFVGKPDSARRSRGEQFLFVNGRFVKHGQLHRAVLRAYEGLISDGQHPLYALYLTVDPARIDVNIHPTKVEVKFDEEQPILAILKSAVKRGLGAHNVAPSIDFDAEVGLNIPDPRPGMKVPVPAIHVNPEYNPFNGERGAIRSEGWNRSSHEGWKDLYQVLEPEADVQPGAELEATEEPSANAWAEASNTAAAMELMLWKGKYLLVPVEDGIAVVHVRRAHLRILFEKFLTLTQGKERTMSAQTLLVPESITLSKAEVLALMEAKVDLAQLGMDFERVDDQTVELCSVPVDLKGDVREALDDVLESFHDGSWNEEEGRRERWALSWAKRAAAKGRVNMDMEARRQLVAALWACDRPSLDPMGRPVMTVWSSEDLEKPLR